MSNIYEQRFFSALKDTFIGHPIKGKSGYVNFMDIKAQYFAEIEPYIKAEIDKQIEAKFREELFEKLYNFFDCYLNETGTVFFANSQIHKNLYEKVYSDRDDVALFWKTQKLYYVKSEANYEDLQTEVNGIKILFDASEIKHAKGNEKKAIQFYLVKATKEEVIFKIRYQESNKYDRLKDYLELDKNNDLIDKCLDDYGTDLHSNIIFAKTDIDRTVIDKKTDRRKCLFIEYLDDALNSVKVEYSINDLSLMLTYLHKKGIILYDEDLRKIFSIYKRQNEIDYFIHKDAEGFLKEQFDIYVYNWLFNDLDTDFDAATVKRMQNIKKIAHKVIEYIARFEDELKAIWEKPKFVKNSNYLLSLQDLKKKLSLDLYLEIIKILKREIKNNQAILDDFNFTLKDIYKLPLQKIYIPEFTFTEEKFIGKYVKLIDNDTKEAGKNYFDKPVHDRNTLLNGLFEVTDKNVSIDLEKLYIDTGLLDIKTKSEILILINKEISIDENIRGLLIKSDNFQTLNNLKNKFNSRISLIYIDPPFNTESQDFAYKDKYKDSTWLSMVSNRIDFHSDILCRDSSEYFHLDANCNYLMRSILNSLYKKDIQREIIWNTSPSPSGFKSKANNFIRQHDTIFYIKNGDAVFNKMWVSKNPISEEIGWLDFFVDEDDSGYILKRDKKGKFIKQKITSDFTKIAIGDVWNDVYSMMFTQNMTRENWSEGNTQKPENLLRRIIQSSSKEDDWVMDYFVGSGTTAAAAHKLQRKWICSDIGDYVYTTVIPRLKTVIVGDIKPKLTEDTNWQGGGFIKYYELEQYEEVLARAKFLWQGKVGKNQVEQYSFMQDQKLLDAIEIDYKNKNAKLVFENLYPDVDIAETLSNVSGKHIKQIFEDKVVFEDGSEVVYAEMTFEKYPWIKPLIWWNSK